MPKFRSREVVEAVQWDGTEEARKAIEAMIGEKTLPRLYVRGADMGNGRYVDEGQWVVNVWLGPEVMSNVAFLARYEPLV